MHFIFHTLSTLVSLYLLVCFVRVILSWVPGLAYSPFGRVVSQITDPYLQLFRKFNPTARYGVDISPIFAFAALMILENILKSIAIYKVFSIGLIIVQVVNIAGSIITSILTFLNIIVLIRLIAMLLNKNSGQIWQAIDQLLYPITQKVTPIFTKNRFLQPKFQLLLLLVCGILIKIAITFITGVITSLVL